MTLAIATLCFCPPEMCDPFTPTFLLNPCPSFLFEFYASIVSFYFFFAYNVLISITGPLTYSIFTNYGLKLDSFAAYTIS
jgi:hypothetical protein